MRSPRYTHDYLVTSQIPKLFGINTALEVDLTGQMNAEVGRSAAHRSRRRACRFHARLHAVGGRARHRGDAGDGARRRRVAHRAEAGRRIVTTSRSDADVVVTEYGVAELRGRSVSERAAALIAIAHPDFGTSRKRGGEADLGRTHRWLDGRDKPDHDNPAYCASQMVARSWLTKCEGEITKPRTLLSKPTVRLSHRNGT